MPKADQMRTVEQSTRRRRGDLGFWLVVVGAAAFAFGMRGFSIIPFIMLVGGVASMLIGLVLARPTGRTLVLLIAIIAFVTLPVWLFLLVAALID